MEKVEKREEQKRKEINSQQIQNQHKSQKTGKKKVISYDDYDVPARATKRVKTEMDTSGDTKIFHTITKKDIENEKIRQANIRENKNFERNRNNQNNVIVSKRMPEKSSTSGNIVKEKNENNGENRVKTIRPEMVRTKRTEQSKPQVNLQAKLQTKAQNNPQAKQQGKQLEDVQLKQQSKLQEKAQIKPNQFQNANVQMVSKSIQKEKQQPKEEVKPKYNNYEEKNKSKDLNNYQKKSSNPQKVLLKILLFIIIAILVAIIISTVFGLINMKSNKIIKGVKVANVEVSGLTQEEAKQKLNNTLNNNDSNYVVIKHGNFEKNIYLNDIGGNFDVENATKNAFNIGRESNIVNNNYKTIGTMITGENQDIGFTYNEEMFEELINKISIELPDLATESSYVIENNKIIIKNSKDGIVIKKDEFIQDTVNAFKGETKTFELPVQKAERKKVDIDAIHQEIYKAPVDAYYTKNPYAIYKEENGLDFAISVEDAKKMLEEDKLEYEIELKVLKPKVTVASLGTEAFPNTLSTFTTTYGTGDTNRNANIALAAKSINSVVVMPGEVFSYNDLIGECSTRTGYKASTIYLNGKLSTGVGGGICQVSTTLYNAVLRANLEIVQRRNHSLGVTYVPAGQDAMVNIGTSDFKFKNNRSYPIKVIAYVGTGSVTCQIQGLKQDTEYEVKLESKTIEKTDTKYKVETYKVLYLNGKVVSRTWLSTDTYKYH